MGLLVVVRAAVLPEDVAEGERDRDQEDRARDDVHLRRHGDARDPPDEDRERLLAAGVEVRDHEVVDREGEAEQRRGEHRRREQRQRDLAERRPLVRAEVHRRLLEVAVEPDQPRLHGDDDEADDEHDVGDEDRPKPSWKTLVSVEEERQQRGAEDDLGRRHRQEDEEVRRAAAAEVVADDRERDERPERGRDERREQADLERRDDGVRMPEHRVPVQPVVERELLPDVVEAAVRAC